MILDVVVLAKLKDLETRLVCEDLGHLTEIARAYDIGARAEDPREAIPAKGSRDRAGLGELGLGLLCASEKALIAAVTPSHHVDGLVLHLVEDCVLLGDLELGDVSTAVVVAVVGVAASTEERCCNSVSDRNGKVQ